MFSSVRKVSSSVQNPRHTFQSWRDRWVKHLSKKAPANVKTTNSTSPSPPADQQPPPRTATDADEVEPMDVEPADDDFGEPLTRVPTRRPSYDNKGDRNDNASDRQPSPHTNSFYSAQAFHELLSGAGDIEAAKKEGNRYEEGWHEFAEDWPAHTAVEWRSFFETSVTPVCNDLLDDEDTFQVRKRIYEQSFEAWSTNPADRQAKDWIEHYQANVRPNVLQACVGRTDMNGQSPFSERDFDVRESIERDRMPPPQMASSPPSVPVMITSGHPPSPMRFPLHEQGYTTKLLSKSMNIPQRHEMTEIITREMPKVPDEEIEHDALFTAKVSKWRESPARMLASEFFGYGDTEMRFILFPYGNNVEYVSMYVERRFHEQEADAEIMIGLWNEFDTSVHLVRYGSYHFAAGERHIGFTKFVKLQEAFHKNWRNWERPLVEDDIASVSAYYRVRKAKRTSDSRGSEPDEEAQENGNNDELYEDGPPRNESHGVEPPQNETRGDKPPPNETQGDEPPPNEHHVDRFQSEWRPFTTLATQASAPTMNVHQGSGHDGPMKRAQDEADIQADPELSMVNDNKRLRQHIPDARVEPQFGLAYDVALDDVDYEDLVGSEDPEDDFYSKLDILGLSKDPNDRAQFLRKLYASIRDLDEPGNEIDYDALDADKVSPLQSIGLVISKHQDLMNEIRRIRGLVVALDVGIGVNYLSQDPQYSKYDRTTFSMWLEVHSKEGKKAGHDRDFIPTSLQHKDSRLVHSSPEMDSQDLDLPITQGDWPMPSSRGSSPQPIYSTRERAHTFSPRPQNSPRDKGKSKAIDTDISYPSLNLNGQEYQSFDGNQQHASRASNRSSPFSRASTAVEPGPSTRVDAAEPDSQFPDYDQYVGRLNENHILSNGASAAEPESESQRLQVAELDEYIAGLKARGFSEEHVIDAIYCTTGFDLNVGLVELVATELQRNGKIPSNVKGVWTEKDDGRLLSGKAAQMLKVVKKHGQSAIRGREHYLRDMAD